MASERDHGGHVIRDIEKKEEIMKILAKALAGLSEAEIATLKA